LRIKPGGLQVVQASVYQDFGERNFAVALEIYILIGVQQLIPNAEWLVALVQLFLTLGMTT
jgi:hypothetical protein